MINNFNFISTVTVIDQSDTHSQSYWVIVIFSGNLLSMYKLFSILFLTISLIIYCVMDFMTYTIESDMNICMKYSIMMRISFYIIIILFHFVFLPHRRLKIVSLKKINSMCILLNS